MEYKVRNFEYNGFFGKTCEGLTSYTATFKEWTNDPGMAIFECSDGRDRLIPTFALVGCKASDLPHQPMENKVVFGFPADSKIYL